MKPATKAASRAGADAGLSTGADAGERDEQDRALYVWKASYRGESVSVTAALWYDARHAAARILSASPMDVVCALED